MFDKMMVVINSREFAGILGLLNGWFCLVNVMNGEWGWGILSAFFCWLMLHQWCRLK